MFADERRTAARVARLARDASAAEETAAINRALLEGTRDYARWYEAWRRAAVAREGTTLATARLAFTRGRVRAGEAAPVDTVEALLEVHRRDAARVEAEQALLAARQQAALHLWDADGAAVALAPDAVPVLPGLVAGASDVPPPSVTVPSHPDVRRATAREAQAAAQRQLASAQRLPLPALELSTLAGSSGAVQLPPALLQPATDDLKLGASWKLPLLMRRERGRAEGAEAR